MNDTERIYEEWLVARSREGDGAALDELVRRFNPRLLRHARHFTADAEGAWDVVQEAWLAMVKGLDGLVDPVAFPAWAFRIVHRKAVDWVRRRQRQRCETGPSEGEAAAAPEPASEDPRAEALREALATLEPERRALVNLYYEEELSVAEIAEVLGVPSGTVKSRLYHCRRALRRILEERVP